MTISKNYEKHVSVAGIWDFQSQYTKYNNNKLLVVWIRFSDLKIYTVERVYKGVQMDRYSRLHCIVNPRIPFTKPISKITPIEFRSNLDQAL